MVKLFIGDLGDSGVVTSSDLRPLFETYGSISECECVKTFAFVHMDDPEAAQQALKDLNGFEIKGNATFLNCVKGRLTFYLDSIPYG